MLKVCEDCLGQFLCKPSMASTIRIAGLQLIQEKLGKAAGLGG